MRLVLIILASVFLTSLSHSATEKASRKITFPQVLMWKGSPVVEVEKKVISSLEKNLQLKNAFAIQTEAKEELQLQFSSGERIILLPQTKIRVPQVSTESGEVGEIFLENGALRYQSFGAAANSKLRLKSPFFDLGLPSELDTLVIVDMKQPLARFQVIQGEMTAVFFDFEKTQVLKGGESVTFTGQREGAGIKYDFLLNSRKSPHGVLHQSEKFDHQSYLLQEKAKEKAEQTEIENKKKALALKKKKQKDYEDSFLCRNPFGQKDQCYWKKTEDKCFRYRCNVSGIWGDETERPMTSACEVRVAQGCDY